MAVNTSDVVANIMYLSLYDRKTAQIPEQDKLVTYQLICNEINDFAQVEGKNLTSGSIVSYSSYAVTDGYITIATGSPGVWAAGSLNFEYSSISAPLTYVENEEFLNIPRVTNAVGIPQMWTWYAPTQSILVYPIPAMPGVFNGLMRAMLPTVSVTFVTPNYIFTPVTLPLTLEANFTKYMTYFVAQEICVQSNSPFSAEKERRLAFYKKSLTGNKQPNGSLRAMPAGMTLGNSKKTLPFPYMYYLSGGK